MKKVAIGLAVVLALAAGGLFWAYHSLDVLVKLAIEHYGPDVLGTTVKVAEVHLSAQTGEGMLKGLEIGSPRGYSAPRAARFGEIRLALDPTTLTEDVITVREVSVLAPAITFERGKGGHNLDAIQKNIAAYVARSGGASQSKQDGQASGKRRFIVGRVAIRGGTVTVTNPALRGQGLTFDLPDIELRDVGKREKGLRASEVANVVAEAIIARIAQKMLTSLDLLRRGGIEGAVDALKGIFK
jgi:hypothetical protein